MACDLSGALASDDQLLPLSFVHGGQPIPAVRRWVEPGVAERLVGTQREQVRPIPGDPVVDLIRSADGPVARDHDFDIIGHALEQQQSGEVVPDRVRGAAQVEERDQDVGEHVGGEKHPEGSMDAIMPV